MTKTKTTAAPINLMMGPGIEYRSDGDELTILIDCTGYHGRTKNGEGKNHKIASSGGRASVAKGMKANINLYSIDPGMTEGLGLEEFAAVAGRTVQLGDNLIGTFGDDGILTVIVDMGADFGLTKSEKGRKIASTGGNQGLFGALKLGINIDAPKGLMG